MTNNLVSKVSSTKQDNLIAKITPSPEVIGVVIRKTAEETVLERGTVLALSSIDRKVVILGTEEAEGEVLAPAYILCDTVTVDSTADATGVAYRNGNFNRKAVICAEGHTFNAEDEDNLREYGIVFTDMLDA